jgi:hypothetical protein
MAQRKRNPKIVKKYKKVDPIVVSPTLKTIKHFYAAALGG